MKLKKKFKILTHFKQIQAKFFNPVELLPSIFFYEETPSGGFAVYESYAVRGGSPVTKRLFDWGSGRQFNSMKKSFGHF